MTDKELATRIIELSGGKENISKAVHCITRLRMTIIDQEKFQKENITEELGLQVIISGGQNQVVIGPGKIDRVYDEVIAQTGLTSQEQVQEGEANIVDAGNEFKEKQNLFNKFIALISGIFAPMLGILAGSGMIKGLTALLVAVGLIAPEGDTYIIMDAIGDTFFIFLPVFVGYFSMKAFKGTPMIGVVLGAILVSPAITALGSVEPSSVLFPGTFFESNIQASLFGMPIILGLVGYTYSVIPIIAITWIAAKLEKISKKVCPDSISLFMVPFIVILFSAVIGLVVLGPIFGIISTVLANVFYFLNDTVPTIYGFVLGGAWQILVLFGLHWALVPFSFIELTELGAGSIDKMIILSASFAPSFAAIGGVLAVMFIERDKKTNAIGIPAFITGIFGITEPALYGLLIPKKIPFITTSIAAGLGGAYIMGSNAGAYQTGGLGIFGYVNYLNPDASQGQTDLINAVIGTLIAFVAAFILTMLAYRKKKSNIENDKSKIVSPVVGKNVDISEVNDELFKTESMGLTLAIKPTIGVVTAPFDGKVASVFPTKHAIGLESENGDEVLIHVGIDTVNLKGEGFNTYIKQGDTIKVGQDLSSFDINYIEQNGYDPTVFVALTKNNSNYKKVIKDDYNANSVIFEERV